MNLLIEIQNFFNFFDDEVVDFICECSVKYAQQHGNHAFQLDRISLKAFLGILLFSGYCDLPRRRMYWDNSPDVHNEAVSNAMSRNRFDEILNFMHVCDNSNLPQTDQCAAVALVDTTIDDCQLYLLFFLILPLSTVFCNKNFYNVNMVFELADAGTETT